MSWTNYFSKILVINLKKREDRLLEIYSEMERMYIPFELVTAIEHEKGAEGLRLTTEKIFEQGIKEGWENVLIFEDDCTFVVDKQTLDYTMGQAIKQLPDMWHLFYLSGQVSCGFERRIGSHLLGLHGCFATHSYAVSLQGMKEIMEIGLKAPIDNFIVDTIQKMGGTVITQPILTTQREGFSNIGQAEINWSPFILDRYNQKIIECGL